jgi:hypothetical protein
VQKKKNLFTYFSLQFFNMGPNAFLSGRMFPPSKTIFYIRILALMHHSEPRFAEEDPDPHLGPAAQDPDPYPFQLNVKLTILFPENVHILSKMSKTTKHMTLTRTINKVDWPAVKKDWRFSDPDPGLDTHQSRKLYFFDTDPNTHKKNRDQQPCFFEKSKVAEPFPIYKFSSRQNMWTFLHCLIT